MQSQKLGLVALFQLMLKLIGFVEMVGNAALVAASDKNHFGDAGVYSLFNGILDQGFIDDRQHLFGIRLGGG